VVGAEAEVVRGVEADRVGFNVTYLTFGTLLDLQYVLASPSCFYCCDIV
jgi:hypothetical protein